MRRIEGRFDDPANAQISLCNKANFWFNGVVTQSDLQSHLDQLIGAYPVVVFMKGERRAPACGFSARVVDILDGYLEDYHTHNVLTDARIREGIKTYSGWKTIPQIFVNGELIGGSDILGEMAKEGELAGVLGADKIVVENVNIEVSENAANALCEYWEASGKPLVRLRCSAAFDHELDFDDAREGDLRIEYASGTLLLDQATARRCEGLRIDFIDDGQVTGFKLDNPNEPPRVLNIEPSALLTLLEKDPEATIFDVRAASERDISRIEPSHLLDDEGKKLLGALDKKKTVVFYCAHGSRSAAAASHALQMGFHKVINLAGGIEAWEKFAAANQIEPA